jgi:GNAT superfamily N-acetyltransferase
MEKTKDSGPFAFKHVGQWLAVVENADDEPEKWRMKQHQLSFAECGSDRERSWGSAVMTEDEKVYIYGYEEHRGKGIGKRRLLVARAPAEKLDDFKAWQFRTSDSWSEKPTDAAPLADGLATEFSVSRVPGSKSYVAVYTENGLGDRIVGRFSKAPEGPWCDPVLLYTCPEMEKDKGVFSYGAKAHPWAVTGNELVVSYCVNTWEFARLFQEEEVYRPKFVRIELARVR